jgi:hypothetical protein
VALRGLNLIKILLQNYIHNTSGLSCKNKELERLEILLNDAVPRPNKFDTFEKESRIKALMAIAKSGSFDFYIDSGGKDHISLAVLGEKLLNDGFKPYQVSLAVNDWIIALNLDELGNRFVKDNSGGTIDYLTGLTWKTYALGQSANNSATQFTTIRSNEIPETLSNYPGWRLPTKAELLSLIRCKSGYLGHKDKPDGKSYESAIHPEAFPNTDSRKHYLVSERVSGVSDGRYTGYGMVHFGSSNPGSFSFTDGRCFIRLVKE